VASPVYVLRVENEMPPERLAARLPALCEAAGLDGVFQSGDLVAVKLHLGEKPNTGYLRPPLVKVFADALKNGGSRPFLTDTCTLYNGRRQNAVDYLNTAREHGFTPEAAGAPVVIADGLVGGDQVMVDIPGRHYGQVPIAIAARRAHAGLVLTHCTGHMGSGYGGGIKNVGMGLASRAGKLMQHSDAKPSVNREKCTTCGLCATWCPAAAIAIDNKAHISHEKCIGCGECHSVCRYNAIKWTWGATSQLLQEKMVEHVMGVVEGRREKWAFVNFAVNITKNCDCLGKVEPRECPDVGVLAGRDLVAVETATLDLIDRAAGNRLFSRLWPQTDHRLQVRYAADLGLGSMEYELVEVK
jgi:uncharacterized Fe-S center protein